MIEINLLPSGAGKRPAAALRRPAGGGPSLPSMGADPRVAGLGAVAVLLLLGGGFWFWTSGQTLTELNERVERQAADSVRLERAIALMRTLDTRRDTIDQKMEVIRQVDTRRYVWPHLLDEVSRATPPYLWLTRVAVVQEAAPRRAPAQRQPRGAQRDTAQQDTAAAAPTAAAGPTFSIEGNAASTEALTRFMRNLEGSPMIRDVSLVTSQQADEAGRAVLRFTLEARWEDPDPSFVETVPLLTAR